MTNETYMNHPNFGLLYRVCLVEDKQELFTTLYAQRLFFLVTYETTGIKFEPVGRSEARLMVEVRLRHLRRNGQVTDYQKLQIVHKNTFQ
ncbi:transcriptional coactivator PipX [Okeania sp.]|uniref:transcriptional coactivator PipX n=1 Tax=Okeania sp. TaxID=3100323 RepID=UPI002B4AE327|nr:PipX family protein [Okeania sp.]MEB3342396.1 PipX family protein [Okeania sp.]